MANQQQSAEDLFAAALELPPEQRFAFLEGNCRDAPALRKLVEDMLADHEGAGSFLRTPFRATSHPSDSSDYFPPDDPPSADTHLNGNEPTVGDVVGTQETVGDLRTLSPVRSGPDPRFTPGEKIAARFSIVRFLARGGMGEVYEVADSFLQGDHIALKMILPEIAADAEGLHRFEQEVILARRVTHPNLCPIYDIFRCSEPPPAFLFLTMKLLRGETLGARLRRDRLLDSAEAIEIARQMISGLGAIHHAGIIHRDIKPNNVMLDGTGAAVHVSVMDFGLARLHENEASVLRTGTVAGTPGYLAPELLLGQPPTQATDVFALGVVFHQLFTGERPVETGDGYNLRPASSLNTRSVPGPFARAIRDLLSSDPDQRRQTFQSLHAELVHPSPSVAPQPRPRLWTRRNFTFASAAAGMVAAGGIAWNHDRVADLFHPLPPKRFVAILNWPPLQDLRVKPMLLGLIDAMANELARAEAFDHNFFVTTPRTPTEVTSPAQLDQARESLGANLVLATSNVPTSHGTRIKLDLLNPPFTRPLRSREIRVPLDGELSLPGKVVHAAAQLLDVSRFHPDAQRTSSGTLNPDALAAFQTAEALMKEPNWTGVDKAIESYREAVDLDPRYARAHAQLALAYARLYAMRRDPSLLVLARANAEASLRLDSTLVEGHLALYAIYDATGDETSALKETARALALDPANTRTLLYQAQILARLNRWHDAEQTFGRALEQRPNFWLLYNELALAYNSQGKYPQALEAFQAASLLAPKNAQVLNNVGALQAQLGRFDDALASLRTSMKLHPNDDAATSIAQVLRAQHHFAQALQSSLSAVKLNPAQPLAWLELGDSYALLPGHTADAHNAWLRAASVQQDLLNTDPSDGPGWMLLAFARVKSGHPEQAAALLAKAEANNAGDLYSQLCKVRIQELTGDRTAALQTLAAAFGRGATTFQVEALADLDSLRKDPRYGQVLKSIPTVKPTLRLLPASQIHLVLA